MRELTTDWIGRLTTISGQVVRTHPVHPELCRAVFICDECQSEIKYIEPQFKYTQVRYFGEVLAPIQIQIVVFGANSKPMTAAGEVHQQHVHEPVAVHTRRAPLRVRRLPESAHSRGAGGAAARLHSAQVRCCFFEVVQYVSITVAPLP